MTRRQGLRQLPQLDPRQPGSDARRLRRGAAARRRRATSPRARARTSSSCIDGELHTPDLGSGALKGITRDTMIDARARARHRRCIERRITRDEVYCADEAFFTGTAAEVTPIRELDNRADRRRHARPDHGEAAGAVLRHRQRPQPGEGGLARPGVTMADAEGDRPPSTSTRRTCRCSARTRRCRCGRRIRACSSTSPTTGDAMCPYCGTRYRSRRPAHGGTLTRAVPRRRRTGRNAAAARERMTERILIVAPSWVGDAILSEPLIALLREPLGDAERSTCWRRPGAARSMRGCAACARVIDNPIGHGKLDLAARARALGARELRPRRATRARSCCPTRGNPRSCPWLAAHSAAHRLSRRSALRPAQRRAPARRAGAAAAGRPLRRARRRRRRAGAAAAPPPVLVPDVANRDAAVAGARPRRATRRSRCSAPAPNTVRPSAGRPTHFADARATLRSPTACRSGSSARPTTSAAADAVLAAAGEAAPALRDLTGRTDLGTAIDLLSLARGRRQQRLRPDARGGGGRRAAGRAVRLVVARLHAAAVAAARRSRGSTSPAAPASSANARSGTSSACATSTRTRCMISRARVAATPRRADRRTDADPRPWPRSARRRSTRRRHDAALAFYQAFEAKDLDAMMATWAEDEEIVCVHPGGTRLVGYDAVRPGWEQLFAGDARLTFRLEQVVDDRDRRPRDAERDRARSRSASDGSAARHGGVHQRLPAHAVRAGAW